MLAMETFTAAEMLLPDKLRVKLKDGARYRHVKGWGAEGGVDVCDYYMDGSPMARRACVRLAIKEFSGAVMSNGVNIDAFKSA